jgi:hypothetical protein
MALGVDEWTKCGIDFFFLTGRCAKKTNRNEDTKLQR